MMENVILNFPHQFTYEPKIENEDKLPQKEKFIVAGMGGSHLGGWLLKRHDQALDLLLHRDYGLPRVPEYFLKDSLIILSSYSGNTEEVLDTGRMAIEQNLSCAVITNGGALLQLAKDHSLPYIEIPSAHAEPRMAIGLTMLALARIMRKPELEHEMRRAGNHLSPTRGQDIGKAFAQKMSGKVPLVYTSTVNLPLAYNWKIKFNETAKIPSFFNVFPELCHNELSGFDMNGKTAVLSSNLFVLFLTDDEDHPRIQKRMSLTRELYEARGIATDSIAISGKTAFEKIFDSILLAEWICLNLAHEYGSPDEKTPLISEFKKRMEA
jgi:glucose/mannose-6-phosphate isomerase